MVQERELNRRWLLQNADKMGDPGFTRLMRLMRSAEDKGHINFAFMQSLMPTCDRRVLINLTPEPPCGM